MPAQTDHVRRDAMHAARSEIRILLSKYVRRLDDSANAYITTQLSKLSGDDADGTALGREAARVASGEYLQIGSTEAPIEIEQEYPSTQ